MSNCKKDNIKEFIINHLIHNNTSTFENIVDEASLFNNDFQQKDVSEILWHLIVHGLVIQDRNGEISWKNRQ